MTDTLNPSSHVTESLRLETLERYKIHRISGESRKMALYMARQELRGKVRYRVKLHRCTLFKWARAIGMTLP